VPNHIPARFHPAARYKAASMKSATDRAMHRILQGLLTVILIAVLGGCGGQAGQRDNPNEYSLLCFNLKHYSLEDRDRDGQRNDPKPIAARAAVAEIIASANPDILVLQEIGGPTIFDELRQRLAREGIEYEQIEYLRASPHDNNIAVLSRFPIISRQSHTNDIYSIGDADLRVARGIIDIDLEIGPDTRVKLMAAHLKSKVYHPLGQTEMRRNEARILGQHIGKALRDSPELKLIVAGDLNDLPTSAAVREIIGRGPDGLVDIRPRDETGDAWTHWQRNDDIHQRIDYILVSRTLTNALDKGKTRIIDTTATRIASDHRPLLAVFRTGKQE